LVARHYESDGYVVLDRNWRVRGGELDLVLSRGNEIVFCEVKTRSNDHFGSGLDRSTVASSGSCAAPR